MSGGDSKVDTNTMIGEGHDHFELIFMMLMGIRTAVGKFAATTARTLAPQDFTHKWEGDFAAKGSTETPAHSHGDFRFVDFAPLVFRQLPGLRAGAPQPRPRHPRHARGSGVQDATATGSPRTVGFDFQELKT